MLRMVYLTTRNLFLNVKDIFLNVKARAEGLKNMQHPAGFEPATFGLQFLHVATELTCHLINCIKVKLCNKIFVDVHYR
jgi:hypothetical protein